jgi:hypothetical protein
MMPWRLRGWNKGLMKEAKMEPVIMIEEVMTPEEAEAAQKQWEQFNRNSDWLDEHVPEVYGTHRGKCICVAGQELFVSNSVEEAVAKAKAAHPEDLGWFTRYIPRQRIVRLGGYVPLRKTT